MLTSTTILDADFKLSAMVLANARTIYLPLIKRNN
jgi:hypothetical protein